MASSSLSLVNATSLSNHNSSDQIEENDAMEKGSMKDAHSKVTYGTVEIKKGHSDGASSSNSNEDACRTEHLGKHRQYWRDMILGVNDGLISTFLLVAGVAGSGLSSTDILLTAIAGALAGAVSMSAGEFIATKSQNEVLQGEIGLERSHIRDYPQDEMKEVEALLDLIGIPSDKKELREQLLRHYESDPEALLKVMVALEFGVVEEEERSPIAAAIASGILFFVGSLPSLLPFIPKRGVTLGLTIATIATAVALLLVGAVKTWATRGNCFRAAVENLLVAGLGGALAYGVGTLFERIVHS